MTHHSQRKKKETDRESFVQSPFSNQVRDDSPARARVESCCARAVSDVIWTPVDTFRYSIRVQGVKGLSPQNHE